MPKVKDKERILKAARGKQGVSYLQRNSRKTASRFLKRNFAGQKGLKVMKSNDLQPRLLYPAKLSFRIEGQIKSFPGNVKLKEFIITKPLLHE